MAVTGAPGLLQQLYVLDAAASPGRASPLIGIIVDAAVAVATMLLFSVISGFLAAAVTGDRTIAMTTMDTVFALIVAERLLRVCLFSPKPVSSTKPNI